MSKKIMEAPPIVIEGSGTEKAERLELLERIDKLHASLPPYPADFDIDEVINEEHK